MMHGPINIRLTIQWSRMYSQAPPYS